MFRSKLLNEYLWSAMITFVTAFVATVPMVLPADQAAWIIVLSMGLRAGVAAVINMIATKGRTISSLPQ